MNEKLIRMFLYPALFLAGVWFLVLNPVKVTSYFPAILAGEKDKHAFHTRLPPYPKTISNSWDVSRLEYQIQKLEKQNKTEGLQPLLAEIGKHLGREDITIDEIHKIRQRIEQVESEKSFAQRVYGMFTFVNFMWMLAILGITISVIPCIYAIMFPLQYVLWVVWSVTYEFILLLHYFGVWEMIGYIISYTFIMEGFRFNVESGFYISLTGMALAVAAYSYSFKLHSPHPIDNSGTITTFWICSYLLPLAVHYDSSLLSWVIVLGYYSCIGFSFICTGLCYYIGFSSREAMERVCANSLLFQVIFIWTKVVGVTIPYVKLFQTPVITFSCILLNLGLLILSCHYYHSYHGKLGYMERQLLMIGNLFACIAIGSVYGLPGLANTGFVFFVLYCMEKFAEAHFVYSWNIWTLVFGGSVSLYYSALYLHRNPELIISLFSYE
jgi:hypothetical protein